MTTSRADVERIALDTIINNLKLVVTTDPINDYNRKITLYAGGFEVTSTVFSVYVKSPITFGSQQ